eukprot:scaffold100972_cov67-Phaeocystis_antarctica.AAC.3
MRLGVSRVAPRSGLGRVGVIGHRAADVAIGAPVDEGHVQQCEAVGERREAKLLDPFCPRAGTRCGGGGGEAPSGTAGAAVGLGTHLYRALVCGACVTPGVPSTLARSLNYLPTASFARNRLTRRTVVNSSTARSAPP